MTLLGQNVNSYRDMSSSTFFGAAPPPAQAPDTTLPGFTTVYKPKVGLSCDSFAIGRREWCRWEGGALRTCWTPCPGPSPMYVFASPARTPRTSLPR